MMYQYKCFVFDSYEMMWLKGHEYIKEGYKPLFVTVIYAIDYTYIIVNKNGEEPEVFTVREEELTEWSAKYSPEPDVGQVMLTTYRDFQGYAISFDLTILTEPDELEELGEEVIYQ